MPKLGYDLNSFADESLRGVLGVLSTVLSDARAGHYGTYDTGICYSMDNVAAREFKRGSRPPVGPVFRALYMEWDEYSGFLGFPIGGPDEYYDNDLMWVGEHGAARIRLLEYCIDALEKFLARGGTSG